MTSRCQLGHKYTNFEKITHNEKSQKTTNKTLAKHWLEKILVQQSNKWRKIKILYEMKETTILPVLTDTSLHITFVLNSKYMVKRFKDVIVNLVVFLVYNLKNV